MSEPMIQEVLEAEKLFMENPELRSEYEYREEELRTYRTDMEQSTDGEKYAEKGLSIEMVAEITALPINQVRKMAKESEITTTGEKTKQPWQLSARLRWTL